MRFYRSLLLIDSYYLSSPSITAIGTPSASLAEAKEREEKARVTKRAQDLGEEELKELEKLLNRAKEDNEQPVPAEVIASFPPTDPSSLSWVHVETAVANLPGQQIPSDRGDLQKKLDSEKVDLPFQAHFLQVSSNFVTISVLIDTASVSDELKPYFAIIQNAIYALGVRRADGAIFSYEEVVNALNDMAVWQSASFSVRGNFADAFLVEMKVEVNQVEAALGWIRDLLSGLIFDPKRLSVIIAKQLQELPAAKRDGSVVAQAYADRLVMDSVRSTSQACRLLNLLEFLPTVLAEVKEQPETVCAKLEKAHARLSDPAYMRVALIGAVEKIPSPKAMLARLFISDSPELLEPLSTARHALTDLGRNPSKVCTIVPMSAIDGSFSVHYAKGISGWDHPAGPALRLALSVLNAIEGFLWKAVRGGGLAYGAWISLDMEAGLVSYENYRVSMTRSLTDRRLQMLNLLMLPLVR